MKKNLYDFEAFQLNNSTKILNKCSEQLAPAKLIPFGFGRILFWN